MTITIWSDIRCPFCYIAKRKLENAILQFEHKEKINLEWKSFELDTNLKTNLSINTIDHYISKGGNKQQITDLFSNATNMAKDVGIDFDLNNIIVANSFKAHKLVHIAKRVNKQSDAKEALLKAYFSDGKNIDDTKVLLKIGHDLGLKQEEIENDLTRETLDYKVRQDQELADKLGISGVPFFIFNNKYSLSGAQPENIFLETIKKAYTLQY